MIKKVFFYILSYLAICGTFITLATFDKSIHVTATATITMCFGFLLVFSFMLIIEVIKIEKTKRESRQLETYFKEDVLIDTDDYSKLFHPLIVRNQELKESRIRQEQFSTIWVHDIKLPLATLQLFLSNNKDSLHKEQYLVLSQISNEFEDKINQRIQIDKVYQLDKDFVVEPINLKKELITVIKKLSTMFILKNISIDLNIIDTDKEVLSDRKIIEYAFTQILNNSLNYSDNDTQIEVVGYEQGNNYIIQITDHGIGIASSDINRVFDFGFTGSNGRSKRIYASSGIGLYIIKQQFEYLNHDIEIESVTNEYTMVTLKFNLT